MTDIIYLGDGFKKVMNELGILICDKEGKSRNFESIFKEFEEKWHKLDEKQKEKLGKKLGFKED